MSKEKCFNLPLKLISGPERRRGNRSLPVCCPNDTVSGFALICFENPHQYHTFYRPSVTYFFFHYFMYAVRGLQTIDDLDIV